MFFFRVGGGAGVGGVRQAAGRGEGRAGECGGVTLSSGFDLEGGKMWKPSFKQPDVTGDAK